MPDNDSHTVSQILSLLKFNHLPNPETILFDRRDTVLYIQQLVDMIQELELSLEEAIEEKEEAEEAREIAEKAHSGDKKLIYIKTSKKGEGDDGEHK